MTGPSARDKVLRTSNQKPYLDIEPQQKETVRNDKQGIKKEWVHYPEKYDRGIILGLFKKFNSDTQS